MSDYIVARTVPSLQMMRVDTDNRVFHRAQIFPSAYPVETHRPQTLRARLRRWVLGG